MNDNNKKDVRSKDIDTASEGNQENVMLDMDDVLNLIARRESSRNRRGVNRKERNNNQ